MFDTLSRSRRAWTAFRRSLLLAATLAILGGCGTGGPSSIPSPTAAPSPSAGPPSASPPTSSRVVVTIEVAGTERYRILLTDPAGIAIARDLLAGKEAPSIPNGRVVRGDPGVNVGYTWHIDPNDVEWADMTMEACDGKPSDVEASRISGDRFCPWSAKVVDVQDVTG